MTLTLGWGVGWLPGGECELLASDIRPVTPQPQRHDK